MDMDSDSDSDNDRQETRDTETERRTGPTHLLMGDGHGAGIAAPAIKRVIAPPHAPPPRRLPQLIDLTLVLLLLIAPHALRQEHNL
eukprot:2884307-Rhodomonas_salina.3